MKFFTEVKIPEFSDKIDFSHKLMFMGSCFTDNIGGKFTNYFFRTKINPFGVIYNPFSVFNSINILLDNVVFKEKDLFEYNEKWHSFAHHGSFSGKDKKFVLENINLEIKKSHSFLLETDFLFITLGTAWVYELKESGEVVSNCHKVPANQFDRRLLKFDEIVKKYKILIEKLRRLNPKIKLIFTVSPIRHLKDGAVGNQVSKSTLILAINELVNLYDFVSYFSSYEIVNDELRDYRFYASDLTHLTDFTVDYIWEKIETSLLSENILDDLKLAKKLSKSLNHRFLDNKSKESKIFKEKIKKQINELKNRNSSIDFSAFERSYE